MSVLVVPCVIMLLEPRQSHSVPFHAAKFSWKPPPSGGAPTPATASRLSLTRSGNAWRSVQFVWRR